MINIRIEHTVKMMVIGIGLDFEERSFMIGFLYWSLVIQKIKTK